jgi:hypothetical protein
LSGAYQRIAEVEERQNAGRLLPPRPGSAASAPGWKNTALSGYPVTLFAGIKPPASAAPTPASTTAPFPSPYPGNTDIEIASGISPKLVDDTSIHVRLSYRTSIDGNYQQMIRGQFGVRYSARPLASWLKKVTEIFDFSLSRLIGKLTAACQLDTDYPCSRWRLPLSWRVLPRQQTRSPTRLRFPAPMRRM